jgi:pilus assembly protein CpaB
MILRIAFFALMAIGLIGFAAVAFIATRPPPAVQVAAPVVPAKTKVLVAARTIRGGSLIKPEDLVTKEVANSEVPADASADTPEARHLLSGSMVRHSLGTAEIIRGGDVMHPGDHGFLAAVLGAGMRAVTVGVDAVTGSAGLIWPGDRVDLILTLTIGEATVPMGRRVAAETVLSDARVIAIDQQLVQGADANSNASANQARTVTLEMTPTQAERVSVAVRLGKLSLALRPAEPSATTQLASEARPAGTATTPNTTWAADVSPALGGVEVPPAAATTTMRVFQGPGDAKEYKF